MYNKNIHDLIDFLKEKKLKYSIRVTTRLKGDVKNKFLSDCIDRGSHESAQSNSIIGIYYCIVEECPEISKMEMTEVKKFITERIRL